jgi:hypothetical protein
MKLVKRNKRKMSTMYKFAKKVVKDMEEQQDEYSMYLKKLTWYEGIWVAVIYHSEYGDTTNFCWKR